VGVAGLTFFSLLCFRLLFNAHYFHTKHFVLSLSMVYIVIREDNNESKAARKKEQVFWFHVNVDVVEGRLMLTTFFVKTSVGASLGTETFDFGGANKLRVDFAQWLK
jgi:hypothetical protein